MENQFDLLNLQQYKVSTDISSYITLLYGVPKVGKTTFAYNLFKESGLLLAFEKGYKALNGVFKIDITQWSDLYKLEVQLKKQQVKDKYKVLIFDTIDIMDKLALDFVLQVNGVGHISDIPYGAGYAQKDTLIFDLLLRWSNLGYNLFFISHCVEKEQENNGDKINKFMPSVNNRTLQIVAKMCDILAFAYLLKDENNVEKRALFLRESLRFQAGTRFRYIKSAIPLDAEIFKQEIKEAIEKQQKENPEEFTEEKETNFAIGVELNFEKIHSEIIELIKEKFYNTEYMEYATKIIENHMGIGAKISELSSNQVQLADIILTELKEKIRELNL